MEVSDSNEAVNGVVYNCSKVNVRKGPGTKNEKVGKLSQGTKVQIFETTTVDGVKWGRTSLGWVSMDYIKLGGDTPTVDLGNNDNNSNKVPSTDPNFTTTAGTVIKAAKVNLRKQPGTKYEKSGTVSKGDRVVITETVKVGSATWGKTEKGWIHMYYVKLDTKPLAEGATYKIVTVDGLNIRAGAGVNYDKMGSYRKGEVIVVYELTKVGDKDWGRTDRGWISMEYTK